MRVWFVPFALVLGFASISVDAQTVPVVSFFSELDPPACQRAIQQDSAFRRRLAGEVIKQDGAVKLSVADANLLVSSSSRLVSIEIDGRRFMIPGDADAAIRGCSAPLKATYPVTLRYAVTEAWAGPTEYR